MKKIGDGLSFGGITTEKLQFGCLAFFVLISILILTTVGQFRTWLIFEFSKNYLLVPAVLFLGLSLASNLSVLAKRNIKVGIAAVLWLMIAQFAQYAGGEQPDGTSLAWGGYLLALPFAAVMRDGTKQKGLRLMAVGAIAIGLLMTFHATLLIMGAVPGWLQENIRWDVQGRLAAISGPITDASCLMIGIASALYLLFSVKKHWYRGLLLAVAAVLFVTMMLTNTRTALYAISAIIAGTVFFCMSRGGGKRILAVSLLALAVFGSLIFLCDVAYSYQVQYTAPVAEPSAKQAASAESSIMYTNAVTEEHGAVETETALKPYTTNRYRTMFNQFGNLTTRTRIWKSALQAVRWNPKIFLRGTPYIGTVISAVEGARVAYHTHNSWLQMLVGYGFPGLLIGLYFAFIATRGALFMLLRKDTEIWRRCMAMLVLGLLIVACMEPALFTGCDDYHFVNTVFFLCTGYVDLWRTEIKHPELV